MDAVYRARWERRGQHPAFIVLGYRQTLALRADLEAAMVLRVSQAPEENDRINGIEILYSRKESELRVVFS
ncbi:hypothetical protein [Anaeroselena agilis]|uniref:Uncharacterized protein n=1 Tax=Anaeroselena agilis TaxID=3063788 RepID=A0ABU3NV05_9FIRM|nr:hypothetical protein [Selenomonadales bacterium 4137-cl]